jgi:hypothetical protein
VVAVGVSFDLREALATVAARLGVSELRVVGEPLAGSPRSVVVRARPSRGDDHVVVKVFDIEQTDEGWSRESAALTVLRGQMLPAPSLLAAVAEPPAIAMADLGSGPSVADRLRGDDSGAAATAVHGWATSLGRLHAGTTDAGPAFAGELTAGIAADSTMAMVGNGIDFLRRALTRVGLSLSEEAVAALCSLPGRVGGPVALSPADTCPDNNIETADGLVLLDFESATVRPVAWDLAYLVVPWPSCWCAWRLPESLAADALATWQDASGLTTSTVDIGRAVVAWAFITTGWFLGGALDGVPGMGRGDRQGPPRQALLLHRLGLLTGDVASPLAPVADLVDPVLRELATHLRATLVYRWREQDLPLPPALS